MKNDIIDIAYLLWKYSENLIGYLLLSSVTVLICLLCTTLIAPEYPELAIHIYDAGTDIILALAIIAMICTGLLWIGKVELQRDDEWMDI